MPEASPEKKGGGGDKDKMGFLNDLNAELHKESGEAQNEKDRYLRCINNKNKVRIVRFDQIKQSTKKLKELNAET